jgi:hypothetical protein
MSLTLLRCALALLLLVVVPVAARAATPIGLATIVDGDAVLVRDVARLGLAEGVALEPGDIVETTPKASVVRLELVDGTVLDLGPDTRLLLAPRLRDARRARASDAYLLQGWLKLAATNGAASKRVGIATAPADVTTLGGSTVEHVEGDALVLFQESGQSTIAEAAAPNGSAPRPLKAGETYAWRDGKASVQPRPDPAFVALLPRTFRDALPRRAALFQKASRSPKPLPAPTYADLEPWLTAEQPLRSALLPRWRRLARDAEFRSALVAHRKSHPEWERILFPPPPPREASAQGEARPPGSADRPYRPPADAPPTYTR